MDGYFEDEQATAATIVDGWVRMGDLGAFDDEGYLSIVGRKKEIIRTGGESVAPSEVEAVLSQHPAVDDCAVFGIPDDEWGEQVKGAVTLRTGQRAEAEELIGFCRERIAAYKCPRSIDFLDEMPREASGKLKKRLLRDAYWADAGRSI